MVSLLLVFLTQLAVFSASLCAGVTGFGQGVVFQTLWLLMSTAHVPQTGDLRLSLGIVLIVTSVTSVLQTVEAYRLKNARMDIVWALFVGMLVFTWIGMYALTTVDASILKRTLGSVFMSFALYQLVRRLQIIIQKQRQQLHYTTTINTTNTTSTTLSTTSLTVQDEQAQLNALIAHNQMSFKQRFVECICRSSTIGGLLAGAAGGFLDGAFGTGGPPVMVYFSLLPEVTTQQIRSTYATATTALIPSLLVSSLLFKVYTAEALPIYLLSPVSATAGNHVGSILHYRVDTQTVLILLQALILLSTVPLVQAGDGSWFGTVMIVAYCLIAMGMMTVVVFIAWTKYRIRRVQFVDFTAVQKTELQHAVIDPFPEFPFSSPPPPQQQHEIEFQSRDVSISQSSLHSHAGTVQVTDIDTVHFDTVSKPSNQRHTIRLHEPELIDSMHITIQ